MLRESLTDIESGTGDSMITLGFEMNGWMTTKRDKTERNIRRKQSLVHDGSTGWYLMWDDCLHGMYTFLFKVYAVSYEAIYKPDATHP